MDLLQNLLGGQQRPDLDDFVGRYDRGAPWDGISDDEAVSRYRQVAPHLPPQMYEESARDAFSRLTPQQRVEFGRYLRERARGRGAQFSDFDDDRDDRFEDAGALAGMTSRMHREQPGMLDQLLGGGGNPLAKGALAGIAAMAFKRMTSGR